MHTEIKLKKLKEADEVSSAKFGPSLSWRPQGVVMAPPDSEFEKAARWTMAVPHNLPSTVSNIFLKINYLGDVARLSAGRDLLDDNFYNGVPWTIGVRRFIPKMGDEPLELSILPLRRDAPIFLEMRFRPEFGDTTQIVDLKSAAMIPQYKFQIEMVSK